MEAYIHIAIARFEWMRPMLTVRIHRHSSRLTRGMSTSRLRREAIGKRACDGLVRAAAGLAAVFLPGPPTALTVEMHSATSGLVGRISTSVVSTRMTPSLRVWTTDTPKDSNHCAFRR